MAAYNDTLQTMNGRVAAARPSLTQPVYEDLINQAIRDVLDLQTYWYDLVAHAPVSIPDAYTAGTVTTASGSARVTGTSTSWPVFDLVNTTLQEPVADIGYVNIKPANMTGIGVDTLLLIDGGTPASEVVPVVEAFPGFVRGKVAKSHSAGATVQVSSLAGLQFRPSQAYPIFTVMGVHSATELELDQPWGGPPVAGYAYQILRMYVMVASNIKTLIRAVDQQYGRPIAVQIPQDALDLRDPQRAASGPPAILADLHPGPSGNIRHEIWPPQTSAMQLSVVYSQQWPRLNKATDRPPWFINPSIFTNRATAAALRIRQSKDDPFFSPATAVAYDARATEALAGALNENEAKCLTMLEVNYTNVLGLGGANFFQRTDPDVLLWNM